MDSVRSFAAGPILVSGCAWTAKLDAARVRAWSGHRDGRELDLPGQDGIYEARPSSDRLRWRRPGTASTGEGVDPELLSQFPILEEALQSMGVLVWPMVKFEADDALASAAVKAAKDKHVRQVIICTPDKDLSQCVVARESYNWIAGTRFCVRNRLACFTEGETAMLRGVLPNLAMGKTRFVRL
jgi:5'-3' exonuclease, N-terminal resolvase-like domain